jgi:hypothetical protein
MSDKEPELPLCPVCNKPVALESAKVDADGHAIHSECYLAIVRKKDTLDIESRPPWVARSGAYGQSKSVQGRPDQHKLYLQEISSPLTVEMKVGILRLRHEFAPRTSCLRSGYNS